MPPVANNNTASDSDDEDYVPPANNQESDTESANKREKVTVPPTKLLEDDTEDRKRKRDALWAEFQGSVSSVNPPKTQPVSTRMVRIEKKYRFAGDEVVEIVEVPEGSPEATKWPLWTEPSSNLTPPFQDAPTSNSGPPVVVPTKTNSQDAVPCVDFTAGLQNRPESSLSVLPKSALGKRPGPRKPKTFLAAIPTSKPKKITTLDKSAMDWRAHIESEQEMGSSLRDELEAHRRGGGYLEKVEFLKRVDERKEENLDVMKSTKRRKL